MSFYLFDLKNGQDFETKGAKPVFEQIGPFVYKEIVTKENIVDNKNFTITYNEKRQYTFIRNMSVHDEDFVLTSLNMASITILNGVRYQSNFIVSMVNLALRGAGETLLITKTVNEILFGYKDNFLAILKKLVPSLVPTDVVGLFIGKNDTYDGLYTIFTGEDSYKNVGVVQHFNQQRYSLSYSFLFESFT